MKIYVDAMGGDLAPEAPVKGSLKALREYPGLEIILAGKLDEITPFLGEYEDVKDRLILEEEPEVITNHESPVMGVAPPWPAACSAWAGFPAWNGRRSHL